MEWPTWPSDRSQLKKSFSLDDPRWARAKPEMRQERRRTLFAGLQTVSPVRGEGVSRVGVEGVLESACRISSRKLASKRNTLTRGIFIFIFLSKYPEDD
ncbi:hypothetical protein PC120_g16590 [Phytophthora cactorum]|nr:hypothetical protein PC120_g16590 [Phytophthora cactorum]